MGTVDETNGWIFTDEGHDWLNDFTKFTGWSMGLLFSLKDDIEDSCVDLIYGSEIKFVGKYGVAHAQWFPGKNLVLDDDSDD